jgi:hypothetical protein
VADAAGANPSDDRHPRYNGDPLEHPIGVRFVFPLFTFVPVLLHSFVKPPEEQLTIRIVKCDQGGPPDSVRPAYNRTSLR